MPRRRVVREILLAFVLLASAATSGCSSSTEPRRTDVDAAHRTWLASHPGTYVFRVRTASSWFPASTYHDVRVSGTQVVAATDSAGHAVAGYALTIDTMWEAILSARSRNELNAAEFDRRGVPVEVDMGEWAVDGGVHYSVLSFTANR